MREHAHVHLVPSKYNEPHAMPDLSYSGVGTRVSVCCLAGLERSMKDLQRQVSSLVRLKNLMNETFDKAEKTIRNEFAVLKEA